MRRPLFAERERAECQESSGRQALARTHQRKRRESVCDLVPRKPVTCSILEVGCTHIFDDAHQTDGASFADVVLAAAQDERRRNHYVQIEVVRHRARSGRHLKAQKQNVCQR